MCCWCCWSNFFRTLKYILYPQLSTWFLIKEWQNRNTDFVRKYKLKYLKFSYQNVSISMLIWVYFKLDKFKVRFSTQKKMTIFSTYFGFSCQVETLNIDFLSQYLKFWEITLANITQKVQMDSNYIFSYSFEVIEDDVLV